MHHTWLQANLKTPKHISCILCTICSFDAYVTFLQVGGNEIFAIHTLLAGTRISNTLSNNNHLQLWSTLKDKD